MKAKIHIALNNGQSVEFECLEVLELEINMPWDKVVWNEVKELIIKPMADNPNADVKQAFPKGRW